jgi:hypothetical protein
MTKKFNSELTQRIYFRRDKLMNQLSKKGRRTNIMSKVKLYSNYVKKANATTLDGEAQVEEIISIVKQALESGVEEIRFGYKEEGLEINSNPTQLGECHTP